MKNFLVVLIVMLTAGCAGTGGMRSSGSSGNSGYSGSECTGAGSTDPDCIYFPGFSPPASPAFEGMDKSFQPYFGG